MVSAALAFDAEASTLLEQLCASLSTQTGLVLTQDQWGDLRRAIANIADQLDCSDWLSCLKLLTAAPDAEYHQLLVDQLTIGETYFFRDSAFFSVLRERILPELIRERRGRGNYLRFWSAGCCSGEEPYSVAIELLRFLPDYRNWLITLLATDINRRFLKKAERGIYERWSLRHKALENYAPYLLPREKGRFEVAPIVRNLVAFAQLNLASNTYPSNFTNTQHMDVIFCRNVLMYLQPDCIQAVIARLSECLVEGGWLITNTIEASLVSRPELHVLRLPDIVLFRKQAVAQSMSLPVSEPALQNENPHSFAAKASKNPAASSVKKISTIEKLPGPIRDQTTLLISARTLADQGQLDAARVECEQALACDKLSVNANFLHATILLELGDSTAAEQALQRTLYLDAECIVAHMMLATLLQQSTQKTAAQRHWRNAQKLLQVLPANDAVPESDGHTAKQMLDMVNTMLDAN